MPKKPCKTNAVRILESHGVSCELREYPVNEDDLGGMSVARKIGMPPGRVLKTLVVSGDVTGVLLACVPVDTELDLKALAAATGNKKAELVPLRDVQRLTGYVRGGVSPVGTAKPYPVFMDETAFAHTTVSVSAGIRGCQMIVSPGDLGRVVTLTQVRIARQ